MAEIILSCAVLALLVLAVALGTYCSHLSQVNSLLIENKDLAMAERNVAMDACAVRIRLGDAYGKMLTTTLEGLGLMPSKGTTAANLVIRAYDGDWPDISDGSLPVCKPVRYMNPNAIGGSRR